MLTGVNRIKTTGRAGSQIENAIPPTSSGAVASSQGASGGGWEWSRSSAKWMGVYGANRLHLSLSSDCCWEISDLIVICACSTWIIGWKLNERVGYLWAARYAGCWTVLPGHGGGDDRHRPRWPRACPASVSSQQSPPAWPVCPACIPSSVPLAQPFALLQLCTRMD